MRACVIGGVGRRALLEVKRAVGRSVFWDGVEWGAVEVRVVVYCVCVCGGGGGAWMLRASGVWVCVVGCVGNSISGGIWGVEAVGLGEVTGGIFCGGCVVVLWGRKWLYVVCCMCWILDWSVVLRSKNDSC